MKPIEKTLITVETTIAAPVEHVWNIWTDPFHIMHWNHASDDWQTTYAENDLRKEGRFMSRMESRDGSHGFDFSGEYKLVDYLKEIEYIMDDGRKCQVLFIPKGNETKLTEIFEAEQTNSVELQHSGWQAILENFKRYVSRVDKNEKLHYEITIKADCNHVYNTMIDKKGYSQWTSVFSPTSHYKGSWEKGSRIMFLASAEDGNTEGMVSHIKENIPNKFISIEHLGMIEKGKELYGEKWSGALENYTFSGQNENTLVSVDVDTEKEYKDMFAEMWPAALNKLKDICER